MSTFANNVDNRFNQVDKKLGNLDGRLSKIEGQLGSLEGSMQNLDGRLSNIAGDLSSIDGRLNGIEGNIGKVNGKLGQFEGTLRQLNNNVQQFGQRLGNLEAGQEALKQGQEAIQKGQEAILKGQKLNRKLFGIGAIALAGLWLLDKCSGNDNKNTPEAAVAPAPVAPAVPETEPEQEQGTDTREGSVSLPQGLVPEVTLPEIKPIDIPEIPEDIGNAGDDAVTGERPTSYKAAPYGAGIWNLVKDHYLEDYKEEVDAIKAYYKEQTGKDAKEDTIIQAFSRAICDKMGINYFAKPQTKPQYMQDVRVDDIDMELVKKYLFE